MLQILIKYIIDIYNKYLSNILIRCRIYYLLKKKNINTIVYNLNKKISNVLITNYSIFKNKLIKKIEKEHVLVKKITTFADKILSIVILCAFLLISVVVLYIIFRLFVVFIVRPCCNFLNLVETGIWDIIIDNKLGYERTALKYTNNTWLHASKISTSRHGWWLNYKMTNSFWYWGWGQHPNFSKHGPIEHVISYPGSIFPIQRGEHIYYTFKLPYVNSLYEINEYSYIYRYKLGTIDFNYPVLYMWGIWKTIKGWLHLKWQWNMHAELHWVAWHRDIIFNVTKAKFFCWVYFILIWVIHLSVKTLLAIFITNRVANGYIYPENIDPEITEPMYVYSDVELNKTIWGPRFTKHPTRIHKFIWFIDRLLGIDKSKFGRFYTKDNVVLYIHCWRLNHTYLVLSVLSTQLFSAILVYKMYCIVNMTTHLGLGFLLFFISFVWVPVGAWYGIKYMRHVKDSREIFKLNRSARLKDARKETNMWPSESLARIVAWTEPYKTKPQVKAEWFYYPNYDKYHHPENSFYTGAMIEEDFAGEVPYQKQFEWQEDLPKIRKWKQFLYGDMSLVTETDEYYFYTRKHFSQLEEFEFELDEGYELTEKIMENFIDIEGEKIINFNWDFRTIFSKFLSSFISGMYTLPGKPSMPLRLKAYWRELWYHENNPIDPITDRIEQHKKELAFKKMEQDTIEELGLEKLGIDMLEKLTERRETEQERLARIGLEKLEEITGEKQVYKTKEYELKFIPEVVVNKQKEVEQTEASIDFEKNTLFPWITDEEYKEDLRKTYIDGKWVLDDEHYYGKEEPLELWEFYEVNVDWTTEKEVSDARYLLKEELSELQYTTDTFDDSLTIIDYEYNLDKNPLQTKHSDVITFVDWNLAFKKRAKKRIARENQAIIRKRKEQENVLRNKNSTIVEKKCALEIARTLYKKKVKLSDWKLPHWETLGADWMIHSKWWILGIQDKSTNKKYKRIRTIKKYWRNLYMQIHYTGECDEWEIKIAHWMLHPYRNWIEKGHKFFPRMYIPNKELPEYNTFWVRYNFNDEQKKIKKRQLEQRQLLESLQHIKNLDLWLEDKKLKEEKTEKFRKVQLEKLKDPVDFNNYWI